MMPTSAASLGEELVEPALLDEASAPQASAARSSPARAGSWPAAARCGRRRASARPARRRCVKAGRRLSLATKRPCTWQARMRSSSITGVCVASDSSKPSSTARTMLRQVRPRVEQPHLRLHREGVAALLHDAGALAVVLADDDQRAAGHTARGQVGQRVGRDVGADRGLEGDRAAQRVVDATPPAWPPRWPRWRWTRSGRRARRGCPARRPARPSGARSASPGSRRRRPRPTAAAPW